MRKKYLLYLKLQMLFLMIQILIFASVIALLTFYSVAGYVLFSLGLSLLAITGLTHIIIKDYRRKMLEQELIEGKCSIDN